MNNATERTESLRKGKKARKRPGNFGTYPEVLVFQVPSEIRGIRGNQRKDTANVNLELTPSRNQILGRQIPSL